MPEFVWLKSGLEKKQLDVEGARIPVARSWPMRRTNYRRKAGQWLSEMHGNNLRVQCTSSMHAC